MRYGRHFISRLVSLSSPPSSRDSSGPFPVFSATRRTTVGPPIIEENYSSVAHRLRYLIEDEDMEEQSIVLVVDDELGPRESLRTILQTEYRVLIAVEGAQAVTMIERQPVDVVLFDLRMPGLSGIRAMERIKSIDPDIGGDFGHRLCLV